MAVVSTKPYAGYVGHFYSHTNVEYLQKGFLQACRGNSALVQAFVDFRRFDEIPQQTISQGMRHAHLNEKHDVVEVLIRSPRSPDLSYEDLSLVSRSPSPTVRERSFMLSSTRHVLEVLQKMKDACPK